MFFKNFNSILKDFGPILLIILVFWGILNITFLEKYNTYYYFYERIPSKDAMCNKKIAEAIKLFKTKPRIDPPKCFVFTSRAKLNAVTGIYYIYGHVIDIKFGFPEHLVDSADSSIFSTTLAHELAHAEGAANNNGQHIENIHEQEEADIRAADFVGKKAVVDWLARMLEEDKEIYSRYRWVVPFLPLLNHRIKNNHAEIERRLKALKGLK